MDAKHGKSERKKIDSFELWCWRRLLRIPWNAKMTNQSVIDIIKPECSLESRILKQKLMYFGHIMRNDTLLEKTIMLGKMEGRRRRGKQRMRWIEGVEVATQMHLDKLRMTTRNRTTWRALINYVTRGRK